MAAYWEIAAHSAYDMFSKYKYLTINSVFSHLGVWFENFFLIVPFFEHCLLLHIYSFCRTSSLLTVYIVFFYCFTEGHNVDWQFNLVVYSSIV